MRRLIWTSPARTDLREIDAFLMSRSPVAAVRMLGAILERARLLRQFPAAGPIFKGTSRTFSVSGTPYSLVYQISDDGIEILRIRHEREDWR